MVRVPASVNATAPTPRRSRPLARVLVAALLLGGCSIFRPPEIQRGNRITDDQLREIVPGVQTRTDVQTLLGSPTQTSTFNDGEWYYISSKTRLRPARALSVSDQETVVVEFDNRGVVQRVRRVGEADVRTVSLVDRETPVPGNDRTLLQALFGNIGRIGPGAAGGAGGGTGNIGPGTGGTGLSGGR